jgi:hypothetical protein
MKEWFKKQKNKILAAVIAAAITAATAGALNEQVSGSIAAFIVSVCCTESPVNAE